MTLSGEFTGTAGEAAPRGFRWWRVSRAGELYSAWFDQPWDASTNEATCAIPVSRVSRRAWTKRHVGGVPAAGCSCGFYALHRVPVQGGPEPDPERPWLLDPEGWSGLGEAVVFGVAEAWGRVLIGTEGWRSRYSRAIALYVPDTSDLWKSDRLRLVGDRYGLPVSPSLESLVAEWAPEPIEATTQKLQLATGGDVDTERADRELEHWHGNWSKGGPTSTMAPSTRESGDDLLSATPSGGGGGGGGGGAPSPQDLTATSEPEPDAFEPSPVIRIPDSPLEVVSRSDRQVAAVERLAGPGPKRILELGAGAGYRASPLAERGHSVVAIAGDFTRIELPGPFDVVGYFSGFGLGTDEDQRRLLLRIAGWLEPGGCALIEVMTPWYWVKPGRRADRLPANDTAQWKFDADACRVQVRTAPLWHEARTVTQELRCYSPQDLRLLLLGTGMALDAVEPYASEAYDPVPSLEDARFYLARLVGHTQS